MSHLSDVVLVAGAIAGALMAIGLLLLALWRPLRALVAKLGRALDIIIGTPEERDPLSGAVLRSAVPDIGSRVAKLEADGVAAKAAAEALALARAATDEVRTLKGAVEALTGRVDQWQGVDRFQADTMRAALTEVGVDVELPTQPDRP